jgi:glycosyltransferase involved in cell wall biosynthesis
LRRHHGRVVVVHVEHPKLTRGLALKVAQVCPYYLPVEGGVENHVEEVSSELVARGHEVHVFTASQGRHSGTLPGLEKMDGVTVHRYKPLVRLGEFGSFWPGFVPELLGGEFDVVHAHAFRHPHADLSAIAGKLGGSRAVLTSHSPFHPAGVRGPLAGGLVPAYDMLVAPFTLRAFDRVVALTEAEAKTLGSLGVPTSRLRVIPNGVDSVHFQKGETEGFDDRYNVRGRLLLYLGRVNRTKGLVTLLKAFSYVSREYDDLSLMVAGPAASPQELEYLGELKSMAEKLAISRRVTFPGRLSEQDKMSALERCSILILPSVYEPFGIVLLEAAAHGKAIIAARSAGPMSIIKDGVNGVLFEPNDSAQLAVSLTHLIGDAGYLNRLSTAARESALGYTWDRIVDRLERVYLEEA